MDLSMTTVHRSAKSASLCASHIHISNIPAMIQAILELNSFQCLNSLSHDNRGVTNYSQV